MEMAMERTSNLVLPQGFVEMDRDEMMYVEGGGFYITNAQLWGLIVSIGITPNGAALIAYGIKSACYALALAGAKIGALFGTAGGPIGNIAGGLVGIIGVGGTASLIIDALLQDKGIYVGLKYTFFKVPYGLDISVK